jgi:hypothetical protein
MAFPFFTVDQVSQLTGMSSKWLWAQCRTNARSPTTASVGPAGSVSKTSPISPNKPLSPSPFPRTRTAGPHPANTQAGNDRRAGLWQEHSREAHRFDCRSPNSCVIACRSSSAHHRVECRHPWHETRTGRDQHPCHPGTREHDCRDSHTPASQCRSRSGGGFRRETRRVGRTAGKCHQQHQRLCVFVSGSATATRSVVRGRCERPSNDIATDWPDFSTWELCRFSTALRVSGRNRSRSDRGAPERMTRQAGSQR